MRFSGHSTEIVVNRPHQIKVEVNIALITRSLPHLDELRKRMPVSRVWYSSPRSNEDRKQAETGFGGKISLYAKRSTKP